MAGVEVQRVAHRETHPPAKRWRAFDALRRAVPASALIAVAVIIVALVALSPLALKELSFIHGVNWPQLSNIGQTYGAASALLTGLALIGVVGSMVFQVRAIKVSRNQAVREQHAHLIEMALTDPLYQRAWGGLHDFYGSSDRYRQHGYINLIISFWQNDYVLGGLPDHKLRALASDLFRGEAGRDFWADTRHLRLQSSAGRRDKRFCQIIEEEYTQSITAGPPAIRAEEPAPELVADQRANPVIKDGLTLALGILGGIAVESFMRRRSGRVRRAARGHAG
jgi:hypothetical protein